MTTPVTIKDIAKKLGISPSTVSRALKNHPDISEETRKAVKELARELNYTPNTVALSLRNRKSNLIAIVMPEIVHHFFSSIISGVEKIANERGYNVVIFQSNEEYEREVSICRVIKNSGIEGVVVSLAKTTRDTAHFKELKNAGIPLVFCDRIAGDIDTDRVVVDDFKGAYSAVQHLISMGCRRIAHYAAVQHIQIAQKRQMGYVQALLDNKMSVDNSLIIPCDNREDAMELTPQLMKRADRPDGIFAVNDMTAIGALYAVKHTGLQVPEDVAVCGFTDSLASMLSDPPLTSVEQNGMQMGEIATDLLLRRIHAKEPYNTITRILRADLIIRESTQKVSETID